jgi:predicted ATPase
VTFLFTDVEGSTKLLQGLGPEGYAQLLSEERRVLRAAFAAEDGVVVGTEGDSFFVAFSSAPGALRAASAGQRALGKGPMRVRMGLHTGSPRLDEEGYVGLDVHRAARIAAAGHGGQVLVSSSTAALVDEGLRDLGEHRLKDLAAAERIYELGDGEFPPLKSLRLTNLPIPATPFVGREHELASAGALLEGTRLLTLTGPGGTGKTRLGLQLAADAAERHPDGIFWVPLAPLTEAGLVLDAAGRALESRNGLAEHIGEKSLLLLLDSFEHVVEAAGELAELLAACPNLRLLVTSRELLRLPGEQAYPVPPLDPSDGEALFLARARAADPAFATNPAVSVLCARLEQLPLALELAAARVRVLAPHQLLDRLSQRLDLLTAGRGVDPRQQTLRATIEWSHELLDEDERRLFSRLAVFHGGCTLEAAEQVCDAELDVLQSLVDKSLIRLREGDRFWMLETIRAFALERLDVSGEVQELRRRHADHFLALSERAEPELLSVDPKPSLDRLESEHDNIRAALDWFEQTDRIESAMRLAGAIWEFWCLRNHWSEGWRRLERLLETDERPTPVRAKVLTGATHLAMHAGPAGEAVHRLRAEQALALNQQVGDRWGIAFAEFQLASVYFNTEDNFAAAIPLCEQSVRRMREVGDEHRALQALQSLAWCCRETGDRERAAALSRDLLDGARAAGDGFMETAALSLLGLTARDERRFSDALSLLNEAHHFTREFGSGILVAHNLLFFADTLARAGHADTAVQLLACAEAHREATGIPYQARVVRDYREPTLDMARAELGDEAFADAWQQGEQLTADEAVARALSTARD